MPPTKNKSLKAIEKSQKPNPSTTPAVRVTRSRGLKLAPPMTTNLDTPEDQAFNLGETGTEVPLLESSKSQEAPGTDQNIDPRLEAPPVATGDVAGGSFNSSAGPNQTEDNQASQPVDGEDLTSNQPKPLETPANTQTPVDGGIGEKRRKKGPKKNPMTMKSQNTKKVGLGLASISDGGKSAESQNSGAVVPSSPPGEVSAVQESHSSAHTDPPAPHPNPGLEAPISGSLLSSIDVQHLGQYIDTRTIDRGDKTAYNNNNQEMNTSAPGTTNDEQGSPSMLERINNGEIIPFPPRPGFSGLEHFTFSRRPLQRAPLKIVESNNRAAADPDNSNRYADYSDDDCDTEDQYEPGKVAHTDSGSEMDPAALKPEKIAKKKKGKRVNAKKNAASQPNLPATLNEPPNAQATDADAINRQLTIDSDLDLSVIPKNSELYHNHKFMHEFRMVNAYAAEPADWMRIIAALPPTKPVNGPVKQKHNDFLRKIGSRFGNEIDMYARLNGISLKYARDATGLNKREARSTSSWNKAQRYLNEFLSNNWEEWAPKIASILEEEPRHTFEKLSSNNRKKVWNGLKEDDLNTVQGAVMKLWEEGEKAIAKEEYLSTPEGRQRLVQKLAKEMTLEAERERMRCGVIMQGSVVLPGDTANTVVSSSWSNDAEAFKVSKELLRHQKALINRLETRHAYGIVRPTADKTRSYDPLWAAKIREMAHDRLRSTLSSELSKLFAQEGPGSNLQDPVKLLQNMEKRFEFASIPMALKNAGYALTGWLESGVVPGGKPVLHNQEIKPVALKKVPTGQIRNMLYKINDDNRTDGKRPEYGPVRLGFFPLARIALDCHKNCRIVPEGELLDDVDETWADSLPKKERPIIISHIGAILLTRGDMKENEDLLNQEKVNRREMVANLFPDPSTEDNDGNNETSSESSSAEDSSSDTESSDDTTSITGANPGTNVKSKFTTKVIRNTRTSYYDDHIPDNDEAERLQSPALGSAYQGLADQAFSGITPGAHDFSFPTATTSTNKFGKPNLKRVAGMLEPEDPSQTVRYSKRPRASPSNT